MQKQLLERFIAKYNLNGKLEIVPWNATGGTVQVRGVLGTKTGAVKVSCDLGLDDGQYCVYDTGQLKSLLSVMEDDIVITIKKNKEVPVALTMKDSGTTVKYALADPLAMGPKEEQEKWLKAVPKEWDLELTIDTKFLTSFVKARGALPTETFVVKSDKDSVQIILGHNEYGNATQVSLTPTVTKFSENVGPVRLNSELMKDILVVNKEAETGRIRVSKLGIMHVEYTIENFNIDYYLLTTNE
jgi:hypothetical protein